MSPDSCARCGERPADQDSPLCTACREQGPLTPTEAARWRARTDEENGLVPGGRYDFTTSDGTTYDDAVFLGRDDDGSYRIAVFDGLAVVYVAPYEFREATPA